MISPTQLHRPALDWRDDGGSALIDTALVMPIFLLFLFGFINFALVMFGLCNVTFATRQALRYASVHSTASYTPTTQATINSLIAPFVYQYPTVTETTTLTFTGGNIVGGTATLTTSLQYSLNLMGYTYSPSFSFVDQTPIIE